MPVWVALSIDRTWPTILPPLSQTYSTPLWRMMMYLSPTVSKTGVASFTESVRSVPVTDLTIA
jgi:hypothetical protein